MWVRMLLQHFLQQQVQDQVRAKVHETVRAHAAAAAQTGPADTTQQPTATADPVRCDVGLVFALPMEQGGLEDRLDGIVTTHADGFKIRQGGLKGRSIMLVEAGVGQQSAARATRALIAAHQPRWIISAGFAGGLKPQLAKHDLLMVEGVLNEAGERLQIDLKMDRDSLAATKGVHVGQLLTVDRLIRTTAEKLALGEQHAASAVDMESWSVADVCRQEKIRFLGVRVISDSAMDELPLDLERLIMKKTNAGRWGAAAGAIFRRPGSLKDMLKLKEDALVASDRLAKFLVGVIDQLPRGEIVD